MIRTATGLILFYMRVCGFKGWTSLWNVIYIYPGWEGVGWLERHERMHLTQMQRDGKFRYMVQYALWFMRYGYTHNPYEVEARHAEGRT